MQNQSHETYLGPLRQEEKEGPIDLEASRKGLTNLREATGKTINIDQRTGTQIEGKEIEIMTTENTEEIPET